MKFWLGRRLPGSRLALLNGGGGWTFHWFGVTFGQTFVGVLWRQRAAAGATPKGG